MTTTQKLNAYFARKFLQKLELDSVYREKVDKILGLLEKANPADLQVKISEVREVLYPEFSAVSANRALNSLANQINESAKAREVEIALMVSSDKSAAERAVWFESPVPDQTNFDDLKPWGASLFADKVIALVTFNEHETAAVLKTFCPGGKPEPCYLVPGIACNLLGVWKNGLTIIHCMSEQAENPAQSTCHALVDALKEKLAAIIAVGIAFGVDKEKQAIGDVLVAESVYGYETTRETKGITEPRGIPHSCSDKLLQMFKIANQRLKDSVSWPALHFGVLLSGNKKIDDKDFRDALVKRVYGAIGGEMEGVGLYFAAKTEEIRWLVVKAICDWADGDVNNPQKERHQEFAAGHAARVVHTVLCGLDGERTKTGKDDENPFKEMFEQFKREILQEIRENFNIAESLKKHPSPDAETKRLHKLAMEATRAGKYEEAQNYLKQALERSEDNTRPYRLDAIRTWMLSAENVRAQTENATLGAARITELREEIKSIYDRIVEEFGYDDSLDIQEQVAKALFNKATPLRQQGKTEEELAVYEELDRRFGQDTSPSMREQVAKALLYKGMTLGRQGKTEEELAVYERLERRFGQDNSPSVRELVAKALVGKGITLGRQGKTEKALAVCEEIERRFGQDDSPGVRTGVALALVGKGVALGEQGKIGEELAAYEEIERRFGKDDSPDVRKQVAMALFNKAVTLGQQGKTEEKLAVYKKINLRFGQDTLPDVREQVASALVNKGVNLGQQGKIEEELAVYEEIERRFGQDTSPNVREQVASALVNKGVNLGQQGKNGKALAVYEEIERRFGQDTSPGMREPVAMALVNKGVVLGQQGKNGKALAVYEEIERRFGQDASPSVRRLVAKAFLCKGVVLERQGETGEALAVYTEIDLRFGQDTSPGMREPVAEALFNKGAILGQQGKIEEELAACEEIDHRFGQDASPGVREQVAKALVNKGVTLRQQGKAGEALTVYTEIDYRFGQDTSPGVREPVAMALVNKGVTLGRQGKIEEELAAYEEIDHRFGQDASPGVREQVAKALVNKAVRLFEYHNDAAGALAVSNLVLARYGNSPEPALQEICSRVLQNSVEPLFVLGKIP
jgi:tetratricopeptide (TPR) repeat protein/nucleoside phosphorylase